MEYKDVKYNGSGVYDPTAYEAICHLESEKKKISNLIRHVKELCREEGYEIEGRIILKNKKTGRTWR